MYTHRDQIDQRRQSHRQRLKWWREHQYQQQRLRHLHKVSITGKDRCSRSGYGCRFSSCF
uniref:Uncharacterized protein n=1 Tax=Picea glauca TaxID=3330 RepID=A0A101M1S5_PICGL|nr:hypothetical protein ABT39_MTgene3893 [Picea glauca]